MQHWVVALIAIRCPRIFTKGSHHKEGRPPKLPLPKGDLGPHLIKCFFGPTRSTPNGISIGSSGFEGLTVESNKQTHTHTHTQRHRPRNISNNRPYVSLHSQRLQYTCYPDANRTLNTNRHLTLTFTLNSKPNPNQGIDNCNVCFGSKKYYVLLYDHHHK